ncbi:MAG: hypothetical protein LBJ31_11020 [Treponema sp.]|nr:hypothetical protein [Treponema sp.]
MSKAVSDAAKTNLDDVAKLVCSRILSLPRDKSAAETAITLLRTCSPFEAGICLYRDNGEYFSYASVGLGGGTLSFSEDALENENGNYRVNTTPPFLPSGCNLRAFSLDPDDGVKIRTIFDSRPGAILALALPDGAAGLPEEQLAAVLRRCARVFFNRDLVKTPDTKTPPVKTEFEVPEDHLSGGSGEVSVMEGVIAGRRGLLRRIKNSRPGDSGREGSPENSPREDFIPVDSADFVPVDFAPENPPENDNAEQSLSPAEKIVLDVLTRGRSQLGAFQGFVIESIKYSADDFLGRIASMVSSCGIAQGFSPTRCLVLFGKDTDAELIAHRITNSVNGKIVFSFQGDDPREAFPMVKAVL